MDQLKARRLKLEHWQESGIDPYGQRFETDCRVNSGYILQHFELNGKDMVRRGVRLAGRIVQIRKMGKMSFAHLQDNFGKIQICAKRDELGEEAYAHFKKLDLGDHIGIEGEPFRTQAGEITVKIKELTFLSKGMRPLPEKFHGLVDVESIYRQRYLDLICNPESRAIFNARSEMIQQLRCSLDLRFFMEVETPILHPIAGGANAKPFKTHYNALHADMYLRVAPELYLKQLLIGGCERVFEISRNFRNEGLSKKHNPEFTSVEVYQAYSDYEEMMYLVNALVVEMASRVTAEHVVFARDNWTTIAYADLIKDCLGIDYEEDRFEEIHARYENEIEPTLELPTFVTRMPYQAMPPLCKRCKDDERFVDVFEFILGGQELGCGYSELNDPAVQRRELERQKADADAAGEECVIDEAFITAMEYGMPPAGGMAIGLDRLVMAITGAKNIRDVILFPQLKRDGE
jgi:lysyl-tRNA synthetase class 2